MPPRGRPFPVRLRLKFLLPIAIGTLAHAAPEWQRMPPNEFWQLPEVNTRIDFASYNRELMAAAIFHESNRVRQQFGRRKCRHLPQLDKAADLQAGISALLPGSLSHHNPVHELANAMDRVHAAGLNPRVVAENIALTLTLDGDPRSVSVGVRNEGGRQVLYDPRTGRLLEPRTYATFAVVVVQQWMDSPHHRANLLDRDLECLGCSARWRKDYPGLDMLYSVQVFCIP